MEYVFVLRDIKKMPPGNVPKSARIHSYGLDLIARNVLLERLAGNPLCSACYAGNIAFSVKASINVRHVTLVLPLTQKAFALLYVGTVIKMSNSVTITTQFQAMVVHQNVRYKRNGHVHLSLRFLMTLATLNFTHFPWVLCRTGSLTLRLR